MPTSSFEEKERERHTEVVARSTTARRLHPPSETAGDHLLQADGWRGEGRKGDTLGAIEGGACRERKGRCVETCGMSARVQK